MNRLSSKSNTILALFMAASGAVNILICALGYTFKPVSYIAFIIAFAAIFIAFTVFAIIFRKAQTKASRIVGKLMPLITLAYLITVICALQFNALYCPMGESGYFSALIAIPLIAALVILLVSVRTVFGIVVSGTLIVLFVLQVLPSLFFISVMGTVSSVEVTSSAVSPDGRYVAQNIMSDQGALGGDSYVEIREASKDKFVLVGTFMKNRKTVVTETEFYTSPILEWVDNETLMVDGVSYSID